MYLTKNELCNLIDEKRLVIRPLINREQQVNEISIDFRLGCDFLVSIQGREAYVDASFNNTTKVGNVENFFQETRRKVGETFLLHPGQTVLSSSLEYIKLPNDVFAILSMRSSYSRLGLSISSSLQPGYCGCISLELNNMSKNAIRLTVGACLFQARFAKLESSQGYFNRNRRFLCQVRPQVTQFADDLDLNVLNKIWKEDNNL